MSRAQHQEYSMTTAYDRHPPIDPLPFARLLGLELVTVTPERVEAHEKSVRKLGPDRRCCMAGQ